MEAPDRRDAAEWNWARTHKFEAGHATRPTSLDELQVTVANAAQTGRTVRAVGARHSFTNIADGQVLIDLGNMPEHFSVAADRRSVTVQGAMTYTRLAELLAPTKHGLANTASLPHLTVAGATSTATHGSGDGNGNLATAIRSLEIVTATGKLRQLSRGDADFELAAAACGTLGIIAQIELDLVPAYDVRQFVHTDLTLDAVREDFAAWLAASYSVSIFTNWVDHVHLWTKERLDQPPVDHVQLHTGQPARTQQHPIPTLDGTGCTLQDGVPGRWDERMPHFRADAVPSVGAEVQSEFFVTRSHAADAIAALRSIGPALASDLMVSEIRTVDADQLWLSPQFERETMAFHFTWRHDVPAALDAARRVAAALAPFDVVPHWGKVFDRDQFEFAARYPRWNDAMATMAAWDPRGIFQNAWTQRMLAERP